MRSRLIAVVLVACIAIAAACAGDDAQLIQDQLRAARAEIAQLERDVERLSDLNDRGLIELDHAEYKIAEAERKIRRMLAIIEALRAEAQ